MFIMRSNLSGILEFIGQYGMKLSMANCTWPGHVFSCQNYLHGHQWSQYSYFRYLCAINTLWGILSDVNGDNGVKMEFLII